MESPCTEAKACDLHAPRLQPWVHALLGSVVAPVLQIRLLTFLFGTLGLLGQDLWPEISRKGALRWGNDAEGGVPYIYHDPSDASRLIGFEVEFAEALCGRLGLRSEFVQNNWDLLVPVLGTGDAFDLIIAGLERTRKTWPGSP